MYYKHKHRLQTKQVKAFNVIGLVKKERVDLPRIGTLKLYNMLHKEMKELKVGRDMLNTILKSNGLLVPPIRQFRITTNSRHHFKKHKDLVAGLEITRPEQVWVSDITYIYSQGKHRYLALITDAYSKVIMGYSLNVNMNVEIVINALKMAVQNRNYRGKVIHHSDRGSQYCCNEYQELLRSAGIRTSMTQDSDPNSNAIAERVNGILKQEFSLEGRNCSLEELRLIVNQSIYVYNTKRPHFSCDLLTPYKMHMQSILPRKEYERVVQKKGQQINSKNKLSNELI